jgi:hypothetical protein
MQAVFSSAVCYDFPNDIADSKFSQRLQSWKAGRVTQWVIDRFVSASTLFVFFELLRNRAQFVRYLQAFGHRVTNVVFQDLLFVDEVVQYCPNVERMTAAAALTVARIEHLCVGLPLIQQVTFFTSVCGSALVSVGKYCRKLTHLVAGYSGSLTTAQLTEFFNLAPSTLHTISMCRGLSLDEVRLIAQKCPNLRHLAAYPTSYTDEMFCTLAAGCPHLSHMSAAHSPNLTDTGIIALARNGALTFLHLQRVILATDNGLCELARLSPHLDSLFLSDCTELTVATVHAIAKHCAKLKRLYISGADRLHLTDTELCALAEGCPLLRELTVSSAPLVTPPAVQLLRSRCSHLRSLDLRF